MELTEVIKNKIGEVSELRRQLGASAELSYNEFKTQKLIKNVFDKLNLSTQIYANTGICAQLNSDEKCTAIRADMDALPVNGISHACGHDYHMAIVMGSAMVLKAMDYKGCIKFIFQPGEEAEGGAEQMIKEGILLNPNVEKMLGFHVWPGLPVGQIEVSTGASMASVDDFYVTFKGISGHAAMPDKVINPIFPAAELISALKLKGEDFLVSPSSVTCGSTPNVISEEAVVMGTVRTFDSKVRLNLKNKIVKLSEELGTKYNCTVQINYSWQYPPVINDKDSSLIFINTTANILGIKNLLPLEKSFTAEDFSFFCEKVPSVHFRLGIMKDGKGIYPLHSTQFNVNDDALFFGIYIICNFILNQESVL